MTGLALLLGNRRNANEKFLISTRYRIYSL